MIIFISDGPGETELGTKKEPGFVDAKLTTILTDCNFAVVAVVAVDVDAADFVDFLDSIDLQKDDERVGHFPLHVIVSVPLNSCGCFLDDAAAVVASAAVEDDVDLFHYANSIVT